MKLGLVLGSAVAAACMAGCDRLSGSVSGDASSLAGTWTCITRAPELPEMADNKTFGADGWHSSSRFPEGKKYKYRVEGDKLIVTTPNGDWVEKLTRLDANSLEYINDKSGQSKVSCKKKG